MAIITQYGNYVKFLRGTPNAYQQATKDPDTLYFVSEENADHGVLYLGEKLISGGISSSTTLEDLEDVLIGAGVTAGSLLYYDGDKWIDKSLADIFEIIVGPMVGASATQDGKTGLVTAPKKGEQSLYLRGDATWADPTAGIRSSVSILQTQVGTLINNDPNKSVRTIASEEVQKIVDGAPAAFDTLKEIADYLADNPSSGDVATRLAEVERVVLTPNTGLQDRVTILERAVGNLDDQLYSVQVSVQNNTNRISALETITDKLKWQKMVIV